MWPNGMEFLASATLEGGGGNWERVWGGEGKGRPKRVDERKIASDTAPRGTMGSCVRTRPEVIGLHCKLMQIVAGAQIAGGWHGGCVVDTGYWAERERERSTTAIESPSLPPFLSFFMFLISFNSPPSPPLSLSTYSMISKWCLHLMPHSVGLSASLFCWHCFLMKDLSLMLFFISIAIFFLLTIKQQLLL